jgi:hypothetical protein
VSCELLVHTHLTDVHELLGADVVGSDKEGLVILGQVLANLCVVLRTENYY